MKVLTLSFHIIHICGYFLWLIGDDLELAIDIFDNAILAGVFLATEEEQIAGTEIGNHKRLGTSGTLQGPPAIGFRNRSQRPGSRRIGAIKGLGEGGGNLEKVQAFARLAARATAAVSDEATGGGSRDVLFRGAGRRSGRRAE
jgi:hypothetical protein